LRKRCTGEKTKVPEKKVLSIGLLGSPEVSFEGRALRFGRKKALALLCYLAAEGGKRSRSGLAELLWPQSNERRARADLRSILSRLRKTLGKDGARGGGSSEGVRLLTIDGDLLGVEPQGIELDLRTLEAAVSLARSETSGSSPGGRSVDEAVVGRRDLLAYLAGALEVYRGEFMEGFSLEDAPEFELWLEAERVRWRGVFGELCEGVSRLQSEAGRLENAIATARVWAGQAPFEEAAHCRLVELLSAAGDSEGALLAYEGFRSTLRRELEIEPSPQMRELAERLREEVEERASLGTSLAHSSATTPLSALEVPFVGRHEEFGALVSEYHACLSGEEPHIVTMIGEAGIGKTRLVAEFLGWARARGADVLEGGASEGAGLPYGPLVEAIRPRIERERAPDDLLEDAWLSELSRLLPELKERYPDLPFPTSGEGGTAKGALFEAIARVVGTLASRAPVVFFMDDLQWADATTLEVLDYAGRRWAEQGAPVLLLIAARPEESEVGSSLERWLPSLGRRLPVRTLALGPLGNEDVEGMLRRLAKVDSRPAGTPEEPAEESECSEQSRSELERFGERLAAETGGQPFYFIETLKALLEEGKLVIRARPDGEGFLVVSPALRVESDLSSLLPQSVREVIFSRLSRLSPAAADLLAAGAVLGRGFGFESLLSVASLGEAEGLRGLDELVERRLLQEEGGVQEEVAPLYLAVTYSFSHEKIRQVVYTEAGQARRRVLHRRAFELFEGSGAPPAELARHTLAAGLVEQVFRYSLAAGDAAAEVFAVREAIVHYERARDVLDAGQRPGGEIEPSIPDLEHLYTQLGRAYEMVDKWDEARTAYETMLDFARKTGEARLEVVSLNHLAVFLFHKENDPRRVTALLEEARRVAEEAGLAEALAETECNLVDVTVLRTGDFVRYRLLAEKTLASARAMERQDLVARVVTTLARLEYSVGRLEVASTYAGEGAELSRELAERPVAARTGHLSMVVGVMGLSASWRAGNKALQIQCLTYLALIRTYQGRVHEGMAIAREARVISKALPERMETMSLYALGAGLQGAGEYEEALALARRGTVRAREVRDTFLLASNLVRLGEAHEVLQNPEEARAAYEEAVDLGHYKAYSYARFCVLATLSEDWHDAHTHARRAHEVGMFFHPMFSTHLHRKVEALLRGGDERLVREEVRRFAERAETNERDRMSYLRSLAVVSEWEGDTKRATDHLYEAEALSEEIGPPGELWQILVRIGELHEQRGEVGEAREAFSRAAQTLRDLAEKIKDEGLREGFLAAPRVRRVLEH
jgi:DNA-binding SARP family transcriptional activator/tetratricopeptide (TPR) repeat protein